MGLSHCGIADAGRIYRSISLNRASIRPKSSGRSASALRSLVVSAQAGQAPRSLSELWLFQWGRADAGQVFRSIIQFGPVFA